MSKYVLTDQELHEWLKNRLGPGHVFNLAFAQALCRTQTAKVLVAVAEEVDRLQRMYGSGSVTMSAITEWLDAAVIQLKEER